MTEITKHAVDYTVFDDPKVYRANVMLTEGYTTTEDIPAIIRVAIMPLDPKAKLYGVTAADVHVVAIDGVAL